MFVAFIRMVTSGYRPHAPKDYNKIIVLIISIKFDFKIVTSVQRKTHV